MKISQEYEFSLCKNSEKCEAFKAFDDYCFQNLKLKTSLLLLAFIELKFY